VGGAFALLSEQKNEATDDPPVIDPRHTVRPREMPLDPAHLRIRQPNQITKSNHSLQRLLAPQ